MNYYYLIAGLPVIEIEDNKLTYSIADFRNEVRPQLSMFDGQLFEYWQEGAELKVMLDYSGGHPAIFMENERAQYLADPNGGFPGNEAYAELKKTPPNEEGQIISEHIASLVKRDPGQDTLVNIGYDNIFSFSVFLEYHYGAQGRIGNSSNPEIYVYSFRELSGKDAATIQQNMLDPGFCSGWKSFPPGFYCASCISSLLSSADQFRGWVNFPFTFTPWGLAGELNDYVHYNASTATRYRVVKDTEGSIQMKESPLPRYWGLHSLGR